MKRYGKIERYQKNTWHSEFSAVDIKIFDQPGSILNKAHIRDLIAIDGISSYISFVSLGTLSHL